MGAGMDVEIVARDLQFPEGPVAQSDGSVLLVETRRQTVTRVNSDGTAAVIAHVGGGPNGLAIGPDGAAYVCNNGGYKWVEHDGAFLPHDLALSYTSGMIQRVDLTTGETRTLYDSCDGRPLLGPNDIVFDQAGGFWFTDFGTMDRGQKSLGALCYAHTDGSAITRVADGLLSPNGVGLSPDESTVYVADTFSGRLYAFDIIAPGKIAPVASPYLPGRIVGNQPSLYLFDSLAVQADGGVVVATIGRSGLTVHYDDHVTFVDISEDDMITNICFGGENRQTAWITGSMHGVLIKAYWNVPGHPLAFEA